MPASSKREQTHARIVEAAARALRREGFAGVGVADVMKQAGLTHGGFYAHFPSREALLLEAVERAASEGATVLAERIGARTAKGMSPLQALIDAYLSLEHLEATEEGCLVGALGSEMARQDEILLNASRARVERLIERVGEALPEGAAPGQAVALAGALVGTLQVARTMGRQGPGRELLEQGKAALIAQYAAS
ncbi:TetR/AcrR family transcriptional regulator [Massilia sp. AB1]|uniref:TetR/AcrR family transcriptional regulator n=1 Tax=Massilia sp. AB1 TaxID=2823371 RepID=UPI001B83E671|nr:TetR/AcrR family transcriptional regulator [Massilia sp. AB1]MBQ5940544.1 TetR/AcrR family transcriptional regulator [Massilia sp. AB1]